MPNYTVERDNEHPSLWRVYEDGVAIGTAGSYQDCEDYLDLIENGEA